MKISKSNATYHIYNLYILDFKSGKLFVDVKRPIQWLRAVKQMRRKSYRYYNKTNIFTGECLFVPKEQVINYFKDL